MRFSEPQAIFLYEGFKYYPLWKVHFQLSCTFLFFFIQSVNCSKNFFSHFVSLYELSLWIIKISRGCPEAKVLIYIWDLAVLLFWGFICTVCTISDFFLVCKLHKSVNYTSHFGSVKVHRRCLYWNVFSTDINRKFIFNFLNYFYKSVNSTVFFWHAQKMRQGVTFEDFWHCHLLIVQFQFSSTFITLFRLVSELLTGPFFIHFLSVIKLYELSLWFQRCPEA